MIKELIWQIHNGHRELVGDGAILVLFVASLTALLFLIPVKTKKIIPLFLSVPATIGCAIAGFIKAVLDIRYSSKLYKALSVLLAAALVILVCTVSGRMVFSSDLAGKNENDLHMPAGIVAAGEEILAQSSDPKVLTMPGWGLYLKSLSSSFTLMYDDENGASSLDGDQMRVYEELLKDSPSMKKIAAFAHAEDCGYVVLSKDMWPERPITSYGYELIYEDDSCGVYREVMTP
ncbi:MAG: hypothetical protein K6E49_10465 [Lachnospiraceae bacterium]|nr:hypothetical protein [Lachnospiraceae bacterium]